MAAQTRVYQRENSKHGGLQIYQKMRELNSWKTETDHLDRLYRRGPWFESGPVSTLYHNSKKMDDLGLNAGALLRIAGQAAGRGGAAARSAEATRKRFQRSTR